MKMKVMRIRATRDSVCMADDCNAPNERILECSPELALSGFMKIVTGYVPNGHNVVWTVYRRSRLLGYLIFDDSGNYTVELAVPDNKVSRLRIDEIFCSHYYEYDFLKKYTDCDTLIEKVKKHLREVSKK